MYRSCVADTCSNGDDFLEQWGYKKTCGAYTKPDNMEDCKLARKCVASECNWNTQVLNEFGDCDTCGAFTKPDGLDENNRICVSVNCSIGEILKEDAQCEACPAWTHPDS
jgi:hypothetical protein